MATHHAGRRTRLNVDPGSGDPWAQGLRSRHDGRAGSRVGAGRYCPGMRREPLRPQATNAVRVAEPWVERPRLHQHPTLPAMRVLLTNDDGIHAPGIRALYDAITGADHPARATPGPESDDSTQNAGQKPPILPSDPVGGPGSEVWTVAPETVQSATSHGVTFGEPLMARPARLGILGDRTARVAGVAVSGRPADCVKVAVSALWAEKFGRGTKPDLVISGMNAGANVGINVIYSGTVAAALEAAFLGIPSIAVSLHLGPGRPLWDVAAAHARRAIDRVLDTGLIEPGHCININIPRCEAGEPGDAPAYEHEPQAAGRKPVEPGDHDPYAEMPIVVCPMNTHGLIDAYERRTSPAGEAYYWPAGGGLDFHATDPGTDVHELFARKITVTPLHHDLTAAPEVVARYRDALH
ncbi:MAG: 5'/3'-nucleotidase SurE [Phycisphaerales bacterium]|nr:MAG: 5'/3'-nucleotidase SurE [Phycisphaerales bacterium]